MRKIYWDSMMFVYLMDATPTFGSKVTAILREMVEHDDMLCTSIFGIGEVLTGPRKDGSLSGVEAVSRFFSSGSVEILPFTAETADRFSRIRASTAAKPADAIHLAAASVFDVDLFLTNDRKLLNLKIPGIKFIADLDGKIFGRSF
jgi:predicted nucleic acid-binding protein